MNTVWLWLLLAVLILAGGAYGWNRRRAASARPLDENDRFAPMAAISPVQMEWLDYLRRAFPRRPVLFRVALSQLVTVRKTQNRLAAQQRLGGHVVDYVVCNRNGKPVYAFELDAAHESDEEAAEDALEKHRVLKTAGIRLIRLKRSTRNLPAPDEFRRRLLAAALESENANTAPAPLAASATAAPRSEQDTSAATPGEPRATPAKETQPMTLTGLMDLQPVPDEPDPWGSVRHSG